MNEFKNLNSSMEAIRFLFLRFSKSAISKLLLVFSWPVFAQDKQVKLTPVDSLLPMLGGLLVILLVIFALAYLFKRFTNFSPSSKNIKVLETQMIGTKEKLVIVKVQQQSFLIGVTPNSISQLGELKLELEDVPTENYDTTEDQKTATNTPSFKSVLTDIIKNSVGIKTPSDNVDKLVG